MKAATLFDSSSTGIVSLTIFEISKQVTVTATGMAEGEYVTFEMATINSPARREACGPCDMPEVVMPEATAWQPLMCCGTCGDYTGPTRLSSRNPVVVLDAPINTRIRAVYNGHDFNLALPFTANISVQDSNVDSVSDNLRGCCPPACECKDLAITTTVLGETSVRVNIAGCPTEVTVKLFDGQTLHELTGTGSVTFTGLAPDTTYSVEVTGDCCGDIQAVQVKTAAPPPCPSLVLSVGSGAPNEATVTIVSGGPAEVTVGDQPTQYGTGPFTFTGLTPDTTYTARGTNDCGNKVTAQVTTLPCPTIALTQTSNTTTSVSVTLTSGGPALVSIGATSVNLATGASKTFTGLAAGSEYTAVVTSKCGTTDFFVLQTAACPAVDFTATATSTTSVQVNLTSGAPATVSVSSNGNVLDVVADVLASVVFSDLPEGQIVTVKAVNDCGKTKQVNVNLPDQPPAPCPSLSLADQSPYFKGFAYVPGDLVDPAATVPFRGGLIYPTAGEGHTVKVTAPDGVTVIGYAANQSECANPCCNPVANRVSVDGTTIDDSTHNYYIEGEVNKCDGTPVTGGDRLFNVGSLMKCVGDTLVPLACGDIVKVIPACEEPVACAPSYSVTDTNAGFSAAMCIAFGLTGYSANGRIVYSSLAGDIIEGSAMLNPLDPRAPFPISPAYLQATVTNESDCPMVAKFTLKPQGNVAPSSGSATVLASYVHMLSTNLGDPVPGTGNGSSASPDNVTFTNIISRGGNSSLSGGIGDNTTETSAPAELRIALAPGQSQTVYAKWFAIIYQGTAAGGVVVHGGAKLVLEKFYNGVIV